LTHTRSNERRKRDPFAFAWGKVVERIEVSTIADDCAIGILFKDRTYLGFDLDPFLRITPDFSDWKTHNYNRANAGHLSAANNPLSNIKPEPAEAGFCVSCFYVSRGCRMTSTPLYIEQETLFLWHLLMEAAVFLWKDWPKHMEIVYVGQQNFNMTGVCPHCNRPTVLTQTSPASSEHIGTHPSSGY
jgi:hypothetical protein